MSRYSSTLRIRVSPAMARAVSRRARTELVSPSEVTRRALAAYLKTEPAPAKVLHDG